MDFNEYQEQTRITAIYPNDDTLRNLVICVFGEMGEFANKVKKVYRDDGGKLTPGSRHQLADEIGDVLWYLSELASTLEMPLGEIAERNIEKLRSRAKRGTLKGSGDDR